MVNALHFVANRRWTSVEVHARGIFQRVIMLRQSVAILLTGAVFAVSSVAHADSGSTVTRASVKAELAELEAAGYNPQGPQENYPVDLMAAEQRVAAAHSATAYGSSTNGTSSSGGRSVDSAAAYNGQ
jgi:hypothetical protein